jgi:hypothetical protein
MTCVASSIPACLPEQLLCRTDGSSPAARSSLADFSSYGMCAPQSRSDSSNSPLRSSAAAVETCTGSPLCEEQVSAISSPDSSYSSAPPYSSSGMP